MALLTRGMSDTTRAQARTLLEAFWGKSNGGVEAYNACEEGLVALRLKPKDYHKLAVNLPTVLVGTTAQKIASARNMLEDLAEG